VTDEAISPSEFGRSFKGFLEQVARDPGEDDAIFRRRLLEHFGADPATLTVVEQSFELSELPNLQVALDAYLGEPGRSAELLGIAAPGREYMGISLSQLAAPSRPTLMPGMPDGPTEGPVEYTNVALGDRVLPCVRYGLYLVDGEEERLAVLVSVREQGPWRKLGVEALAGARESAERFLAALRGEMKARSVYRGRVIALEQEEYTPLSVEVRSLPEIARERIVLPAGVLERVERQTLGFTRHADKLLAAGRHLKRGLLLHGPPGTGKTLTAMYLATRMEDRTTLLVTGRGQGLIERCCAFARTLQPSMVVIEDVDLIAEERTRPDATCAPLLFELLNEMDGLADDADVLFLLTTNRPDLLEPALAARPGRIDLAIELPLPDADGRLRLLKLYAEGLTLDAEPLSHYVARTEGTSGAFIRELMRKAALLAADDGDGLVVCDRHLDEALHELLLEGGTLTRSLLGAGPAADGPTRAS
jgi:hypothetical protein